MPRFPAYSVLIGSGTGLEGTEEVGPPPPGKLWVIREGLFTFSNVIGASSPTFAVQYSEAGPGWQLRDDQNTKSILIGAYTFTWHGRFIVPAGVSLWINANASCTWNLSGYELGVSS